jgi:cytochrome P450
MIWAGCGRSSSDTGRIRFEVSDDHRSLVTGRIVSESNRKKCPVEYDMFADETIADPVLHHRLVRQTCPVHRMDRGDQHSLYSVMRYEDVLGMLSDPELWSSRYGQSPPYTEERGLRNDPPEHTIYRRLINPIFKARSVNALAPQIETFAHALIDAMIGKGEGDLYGEFAAILPVYVVAGLLGVERDRYSDFRNWSSAIVAGFASGDAGRLDAARKPVYEYFAARLEDRKALLAHDPDGGPDDLLSILVTSEHPEGRPFDRDEILPLLMLLLVGGIDTSTYMLTNCVYRLLERRSLWEQVVADPSLCEVAIEESLRLDSPIMGAFRTNTRELELGGLEIPEHSKVRAMFMAANHDEKAFEDPDSFRLDRDLEDLRRRHLAFGYGVHNCPGAPLARLDGRIALRALVERMPSMWLRRKPNHVNLYQMHGMNEVLVGWNERE